MNRQQLSFEINQDIQQEGIKKCFEMGGRLTVKTALLRFGTTELRKIVCRLKRAGYNIVSEYIEEKGNRFKQYWLAPDTKQLSA